jgi:hypothetical protein
MNMEGLPILTTFKFVNSDFTYDRKATKKSFAPYVIDFMDTGRGRPRYVSIGPKLPNEYDVISHYDWWRIKYISQEHLLI